MTDDTITHARKALSDGDPSAALDALDGRDTPAAQWCRALAAAQLGDTLRVQVALRRVLKAGELPAHAVRDIARPLAEAVLDAHASARAWQVLGATVHVARQGPAPEEPLALAWELLVAAAHEVADGHGDPAEHPALVLAMAAVQHRLGRHDEALPLARGAQEAARRAGDADLLVGATVLLASACRATGDDGLAREVLAHGRRWVTEAGGPDAVAELTRREAAVREHLD